MGYPGAWWWRRDSSVLYYVDREGNVVERFEPIFEMEDVRKAVEELLDK